MYLYFNSNGVLKEIVNDEAIRQSNSGVNKIYFFIEGAEPQVDSNGVYQALTFSAGRRTFLDVDGEIVGVQDEAFSLQTSEEEIPFDKKRELKWFKYFTKYEMFHIDIPDDVLNYNGTFACRINMVNTDLSILTLGLVVFNIEVTGGDAIISPDTAITIAQWNYLTRNMLTNADLDNEGFRLMIEGIIADNVDSELSRTSEHAVQNKVITDKMGFRYVEEDVTGTKLSVFYDTYGLGRYIISIFGVKYLFVFSQFDTVNSKYSGTLTSLSDLMIYYADNVTIDIENTYMLTLESISTKKSALLVKTFTTSANLSALGWYAYFSPIFKIDNDNTLYIGHYNPGGECEIESLNGPERWYASSVSGSTTLAQFMVDANRDDYALESALAEVYKPQGSATVATLNGLTITESMNGYVYNMSDSGNLVNEDASTVAVNIGDNVVLIWNNGSWYWDKLSGIIDLSGYVPYTGATTNVNITNHNLELDGSAALTSSRNGRTYKIENSGGNNYGGDSGIDFYVDGSIVARLSKTNFRPIISNADLGSTTYTWRDLYLSRNLTDGTNSYTVAESFGVIFNKLGTGSTVIKWSELCLFDLTANTTFTFETPKASSVPEYKAIINNNGASSITLTFTGVTNILCNDDNCVVTNGTDSTLVLPTGVSIELSVLDGMMVAINFEAQ